MLFILFLENVTPRLKSGTGSTSSTISSSELEFFLDRLQMNKFRETTKANYYGIWKLFNHFILQLDQKPDNWEHHLTLFVAYLIHKNKKSTTVKCYISAIKAILALGKVKLNEDRILLNSLTTACKKTNDRVKIIFPVTKAVLYLLLAGLEKLFAMQPYLLTMYKALFITTYYGLFRIGEMVVSDK